MPDRKLLLYYSWNRPAETDAPLVDIDDRFPTIFELRRLFFPQFEGLSDPGKVDQGIAGFLDHVQKPNFQAFADLALSMTGHAADQAERSGDDGSERRLDDGVIDGADTIVIISYDSLRTDQEASPDEVATVRRFLGNPDNMIFVCPHHAIGEVVDVPGEERLDRQIAEHLHHGDRAIPPRQGFGGYARSLLAGLGVPIDNRFGLRPAATSDGFPAPVEINRAADVLGLMEGVDTLNLHPHLPQLECVGPAVARMDVLARQAIDMDAPPHPFTADGRTSFDALLQSRPDTFPGKLLVCDTTTFSSTAGGTESLRRFWSNIFGRPRRI
jgi:hypothetical protein